MKLIMLCISWLMASTLLGQSLGLPDIPSCITTPEKRASFLVEHYWDFYPFGKNTLPADTTEQALVNYLDLFRLIPTEEAKQATHNVMTLAAKSEADIYTFYNLLEKYLYDSESPMRDEELFIPVLEAFLQSPLLDEGDRIRPAFLLEMVRKNRVGQPAADFSFTLRDGRDTSLSQMKECPTLLYFYDPDCDECREVSRELADNPLIRKALGEGKLQILAIYTGEDAEHWKETVSDIPSAWHCGYDKSQVIIQKELYDLQAFPTLYLLDAHKNVIQKETNTTNINNYLLTRNRE